MIKIGQINMGKGITAIDELRLEAGELHLDVLLLQEPYIAGGNIMWYGAAHKIVAGTGDHPKVAIVVLNPNITVTKVHQWCNQNWAVAELVLGSTSIITAAAYFNRTEPIEPHIEKIKIIRRNMRTKKGWLLIGADANAQSPLRHSRTRDRRGAILEQLVLGEQFTI